MKKLLLSSLCFIATVQFATAQLLCIQCFNQNDSIAGVVNNHILNGGFENTTCISNQFNSSYCPNSGYFSCTVANWVCTGGGSASYPSIDDNTFTMTADGSKAAYLGNGSNAYACSTGSNDTSCLSSSNCEITTIPAGYPTNDATYGGSTGVSLSQTVTGLTIGTGYVLEFWAGGEPQTNGWTLPGVFAVDIGFGNTYLRCKPTRANPVTVGTRFLIQFKATATSHTIKFTNWGHICIPCTEVILDNVRLYTIAELPGTVASCLPTESINELNENSVSVFPNPVNQKLTVTTGVNEVCEIIVFDVTSQVMKQQSFTSSVVLNTEALAKGVYFYEVRTKKGIIKTGKIVKEY